MRKKNKPHSPQSPLNRPTTVPLQTPQNVAPEAEESKPISRLSSSFNSRNLNILEAQREDFTAFELSIQTPFAPRDSNEEEIVGRIVAAKWRLRQIGRFESELLNRQLESGLLDQLVDAPKTVLSPFAGQVAHLERSLEKTLKELEGYRKGKFSADQTNSAFTKRTGEASTSAVVAPPKPKATFSTKLNNLRPVEEASTTLVSILAQADPVQTKPETQTGLDNYRPAPLSSEDEEIYQTNPSLIQSEDLRISTDPNLLLLSAVSFSRR